MHTHTGEWTADSNQSGEDSFHADCVGLLSTPFNAIVKCQSEVASACGNAPAINVPTRAYSSGYSCEEPSGQQGTTSATPSVAPRCDGAWKRAGKACISVFRVAGVDLRPPRNPTCTSARNLDLVYIYIRLAFGEAGLFRISQAIF